MGDLVDSYKKSGIIGEPLVKGNIQECENCNEPTGRCDEDSFRLEDGYGPLCEACYDLSMLEHSPSQPTENGE